MQSLDSREPSLKSRNGRGKRLPWHFRRRFSKVSTNIFNVSRRFADAAWEIDRAVNIFLILKPYSLEPQIALGEVRAQRQELLNAIDELDTILADVSRQPTAQMRPGSGEPNNG